jgi:hypothetical protein
VTRKDRPATLVFSVSIEPRPLERGIRITVVPADEHETLRAGTSTVAVSLWREDGNAVRGSITHASSAVAYFQGAEPLLRLAEILDLRLETTPQDPQRA